MCWLFSPQSINYSLFPCPLFSQASLCRTVGRPGTSLPPMAVRASFQMFWIWILVLQETHSASPLISPPSVWVVCFSVASCMFVYLCSFEFVWFRSFLFWRLLKEDSSSFLLAVCLSNLVILSVTPCWSILYTWHLLHVCLCLERDPLSVALPIKGVFAGLFPFS